MQCRTLYFSLLSKRLQRKTFGIFQVSKIKFHAVLNEFISFFFRLVIDRETGKPKGYGFCEYKDEETALSARRNLQGYEINGRQLRVDFAENDKGADRNREQVTCSRLHGSPL